VFDAAAQGPSRWRSAEFAQHYPASGWVEHDLEDIWQDVVTVLREAVAKATGHRRRPMSAAIGITNQRETVAVWERATGKPVHRAIVWQDRRTADTCAKLKADGRGARCCGKDRAAARSLFLRHQAGLDFGRCARARARRRNGRACFRHDRLLLAWRLTRGKVHATDPTNASRTHDVRYRRAGVGRGAAAPAARACLGAA